jgi:hypothetical protein
MSKPNQFRSLIAASGQSPVAEANLAVVPRISAASARKVGKRTSPDYVQVGVYIPRALHNQAKVMLIQEGMDRDFSQLVGDLLEKHLGAS